MKINEYTILQPDVECLNPWKPETCNCSLIELNQSIIFHQLINNCNCNCNASTSKLKTKKMSLKRLQSARNLYHSSQIRPSHLLGSFRNYSNALSNASDLFKPNDGFSFANVKTLTFRSTMVIHFTANVVSKFKIVIFCFWGFGFMFFLCLLLSMSFLGCGVFHFHEW